MIDSTHSSIEPGLVLPLFGARDQHLRRLRERFNVEITHRDGEVRIHGEKDAVHQASEALERLAGIVRRRGNLTPELFDEVIGQVTGKPLHLAASPRAIEVMNLGQEIRARTPGQAEYIRALRNHELVFATGPAGTGKTWLAVAVAVEMLKHHQVRKIVLVRPAVEAGENLGFLPGDLQAKINPYLRPLLDAANEMVGYDQVQRLIQQDVIEVAPLAYMRGRTLNNAFIILDEAQNTTVPQMKMFLTRMGTHSRAVVSGDPTQVDLPRNTASGLRDALSRLRGIKGIEQIRLSRADIVRHRLVQEIVDAYESGSGHAPDQGSGEAK